MRLLAFIFFATSLFIQSASAANYYWYRVSHPYQTASSPMALCTLINSGSTTGVSYRLDSATSGSCLYMGAYFSGGAIQRSGDSCPVGQSYDSVTGSCKAPGGDNCGKTNWLGAELNMITNSSGACVKPQDADLPSLCRHLSKQTRTGSTIINFDGGGNPINPGPIQMGGCQATPIDVSHCKQRAPASAGGVTLGAAPARCKVGLSFSGAVASTDPVPYVPPPDSGNQSGLCHEGQDCTPPDLPVDTSNTPCTYVTDAEGRKSCSSSKYTGTPGSYDGCGTGPDGVFKCYGKQPSSNGIKIDTNISTAPTDNGGSKTTKDDTSTKVVCSGIGSCTTTTNKTSQVTIKDGNGNVTSQTTSCTGPDCSKSGAGEGGDKDGDGLNDCAASKEDCTGSGAGSIGAPELDEQPSIADTTQAYFNRIKNAPIAQALSIAVPTGGTCPVGSANTFFGTIRFDSFCDLAPSVLSGLRYLFLAIWAWAAVRLFFTA